MEGVPSPGCTNNCHPEKVGDSIKGDGEDASGTGPSVVWLSLTFPFLFPVAFESVFAVGLWIPPVARLPSTCHRAVLSIFSPCEPLSALNTRFFFQRNFPRYHKGLYLHEGCLGFFLHSAESNAPHFLCQEK